MSITAANPQKIRSRYRQLLTVGNDNEITITTTVNPQKIESGVESYYWGWFKLFAPTSFRVRCPIRFSEVRRANLHVFPCRTVFDYFLFPAGYWGFCIFWDVWVLNDPTFLAKKIIIAQDSAGATRAKLQGHLSKTAWTFGLLCVKRAKITVSTGNFAFTWFQCRFDFGS